MFKHLSIAVALMIALPAFAADYIVKYKKGAAFSVMNMEGVQTLDQHEKGQLIKVSLDKSKNDQLLKALKAKPEVDYVVENFQLKAFKTPKGVKALKALKEQWAILKVNAQDAWSMAGNKGRKNVTVAVIDTGVDYNHASLMQNMVEGYDFNGKDADPMDETSMQNPGHGTHCAGIVGATGEVDGGIVGLAPNISIMPIRFLGSTGGGDLMDGIRSIDYAIEKKVQVISASWGAAVSTSQAKPLIEAVKRASDAGIVFVAAAANDGANNDRVDMYPANANFDNTITVAASGPNDEKPNWSNYGRRKVHLASPGLDIMSTLPSNKYGKLSGTSMATPLVSGLVALLISQDSSLTGKQVKALLQKTGAKVSIETACNCRVDAAAAMDVVLKKTMFLAPSAFTANVGETFQFEAKNASGTVTFESSNPSVLSIDAEGNAKAVTEGDAVVKATDAAGNVAETLKLLVANSPTDGGGGSPPGGGMPGDGQCPLDPALCEIACQFQPELPWCKGL